MAKCAEFANALKHGQQPRWLSILGVTGTGKTHCANRLWSFAYPLARWQETAFMHHPIYWPSFVSELRGGNAYDKARDLQRWPVLFLDDIGAERDTTGFATEQLNTLLGCRMNRWTILTSNLNLEHLAEIDPRIADRVIRRPNIFIELDTISHALR